MTLLTAACGDDDEAEASGEPILCSRPLHSPTPFTEIAAEFEAANEGAAVELSFGASSALATQVTEGAPASAFASASGTQMNAVVDAGHNDTEPVGVRHQRARDRRSTRDRERGGQPSRTSPTRNCSSGLCAEDVPCGDFAVEMFANAGITPSIDTFEPDVRALFAKVESGELDAGIVYHSDVVASADGVVGVPTPREQNVVAFLPDRDPHRSDRRRLGPGLRRLVHVRRRTGDLQTFGFAAP